MSKVERFLKKIDCGTITNDDLWKAMREIEETSTLAYALADFILNSPGDERVGAALFALGKADNPAHRDVFVQAMRDSVDGDQNALHQAIICLANIGIRVCGQDCFSSDHKKNRAAAVRWLKKLDRGVQS